jgi:hypothetical protein
MKTITLSHFNAKKKQHIEYLKRLKFVVFEKQSINSLAKNISVKLMVTILFIFSFLSYNSQVVSPFDIRFQANQKGGIQMISNVAVTCNSANNNCQNFQNQFPPNGNHNQDGGVTMDYVDIDFDGSTFMSSSDSLALPSCSKVTWAGLYWSARVDENTVEYVTRDEIKIKLFLTISSFKCPVIFVLRTSQV